MLSVNSGRMSIAFDGTCWHAGVRSQTGSAMRGEDVGCPIKVVLPMPTQIARNHPGSLSVAPHRRPGHVTQCTSGCSGRIGFTYSYCISRSS